MECPKTWRKLETSLSGPTPENREQELKTSKNEFWGEIGQCFSHFSQFSVGAREWNLSLVLIFVAFSMPTGVLSPTL